MSKSDGDDFLRQLARWFGQPDSVGYEPSDIERAELIYRIVSSRKRASIRHGPYSGPSGSKQRIIADRFARKISRFELKKMRRSMAINRPKDLEKHTLLVRFSQSPILDKLVRERKRRWRTPLRRILKENIASVRLKNFSFLTHPNETLNQIREIGEVELSESKAYLHFDDEYCLDAGAYLVLAEVWHSVKHCLVGGKMDRPVQKVLAATGVSHHNNMKLLSIGRDSADDQADVWAFSLQRRRPALTTMSPTVHLEPQTREKTADQFCDKVDEWLGVPDINQELTLSGRGWIAQIIGELLCNAERHSRAESNDGDWSTTAFMTRREVNGHSTLRCHIAFLSVGRSFAESLQGASADIRDKLNQYITRHERAGLSAGTLATVFALQDTVTRDPEARDLRSGGTGLQDVLEFVNLLGQTEAAGMEPRVTVVSGASCIQMQPPYIQGMRKGGATMPRLIWFNERNDWSDPPDGGYVKDLSHYFSGTLVSIAFTLDPAYLAAHMESDDAND